MKYFVVILISFVIVSCNGQSNRTDVSIKVLNKKGSGLPESRIEFDGQDTSFVVKTDFEGNIDLKNLKSGTYKVSISYVGHYSLKDYSILIGKEQELNFEMKLIDLDSTNIQWNGGWVTFEDEKGKVKSVKIKE